MKWNFEDIISFQRDREKKGNRCNIVTVLIIKNESRLKFLKKLLLFSCI